MGNQLFIYCLKGSLLVTFREFKVLAYTQNMKYVLIINVYLHMDDFYVHYKNSKCDTIVIK